MIQNPYMFQCCRCCHPRRWTGYHYLLQQASMPPTVGLESRWAAWCHEGDVRWRMLSTLENTSRQGRQDEYWYSIGLWGLDNANPHTHCSGLCMLKEDRLWRNPISIRTQKVNWLLLGNIIYSIETVWLFWPRTLIPHIFWETNFHLFDWVSDTKADPIML